MFIEPIVVKATPKTEDFTIHEDPIVNLKTYVHTNNQVIGENSEAWRANTRIVKQEMFGAATQSLNDDTVALGE